MLGGVAALVGAKILGPRIGKYDENGKPRAILGHNLTLAALGVFILWFAWFGFNGCSTLGLTSDDGALASKIFMTTNIAAAVAAITVMLITWVRYKKPDVSMTLNGALAGLVAITAGCDAVSRGGAAIIGIVAAFVVVFGIEFVEKILKIDDPVGAIGVHGFCGAAGTIMVGLLADGSDSDPGLFYGGSASVLGIQILGVVAVAAWVAITMGILFTIIDKTNGLRVSREEEILGLDSTEHNLAAAYADFQYTGEIGTASETVPASTEETPVYDHREEKEYKNTDGTKLSKVVILTSQSTFDALKHSLDNIGITGMTVTQVQGCGVQRGMGNYYRGAKVDTTLLPKVKVEVVVSKVPVSLVVDTVKKALASDKIGAGKIFIYDVENVIRVRTGEEGEAALQDK